MNDDLISRQAVLDLLFNSYIKTELTSIGDASKEYAELCVDELKELPSVNPQEPKCDRLYDWLNDMRYGIAPDENTPDDERREREAQVDVIDDIMEWIEKHPQEPKTGHWNCGDDMFEYAICSSCKHETGEAWEYAKRNFKYCPNCGCRMVEPQESEDKE